MEKTRFIGLSYVLLHAPKPGERESRYHQAKDRTMNRPCKEERHV